MKQRMNFTFDDSTAERLRQLAFEKHKSMSQTLTDLVWGAHVSYSQIRGQLSFDTEPSARKKKGKSEKAKTENS